jgi:hypothetical protein
MYHASTRDVDRSNSLPVLSMAARKESVKSLRALAITDFNDPSRENPALVEKQLDEGDQLGARQKPSAHPGVRVAARDVEMNDKYEQCLRLRDQAAGIHRAVFARARENCRDGVPRADSEDLVSTERW